MGLTNTSTGLKAAREEGKNETMAGNKVIALGGNPNVGKSTLFNGLTGMNQHTGNWPGKTVTCAKGQFATDKHTYTLVDIPGTYSLMANSQEEEVARDYICFGKPDLVVLVCDATCLERNLNLVLQTLEMTSRLMVCVNLLDEAKRKGISVDIDYLEESLGIPVVGIVARHKKGSTDFSRALDIVMDDQSDMNPLRVAYSETLEKEITKIQESLPVELINSIEPRWLSIKLLKSDEGFMVKLKEYLGMDIMEIPTVKEARQSAWESLRLQGYDENIVTDEIVASIVNCAEEIGRGAASKNGENQSSLDRRFDEILTSRRTGYPVMIGLLALVFWITITGANYPSQLLSSVLFWFQGKLTSLFMELQWPSWLHELLVLGVYRVLAWVVSVMLPPMAIFFPLFTLLEDVGYLPRIAYNMDKTFKKCSACGKQALTMCMGFGCNAAGVIGCRIIDSPREKLLAILTNSFVPCNGRFPTLIALITMFFIGTETGLLNSLLSVAILTSVIIIGVGATFGVTKLLSLTVLKGVSSSFTLELPPYRKPQVGKVIVRSILDRTIFVLGRAVVVAAPAGAVIWILANTMAGETSLLKHCSDFLEPFANLMGMDGIILLAFILGFPANEIVIPIIIMAYMSSGSIMELDSLLQMKELFIENGWTWTTACSTILFSLMHWPCSTTLLTIRKETGSWKWTFFAAVIPTLAGILVCMVFTFFLS